MKHLSLVLCAALIGSGITSCSKSNNDTTQEATEKQYGIFVRAGSPSSDYVLSSGSLTTGSVLLQGNGAEVTTVMTYSAFAKNGYYYNLKDNKLSKFQLANNQLTSVAAVPFSFITSLGTPVWLDDNNFLVVNTVVSDSLVKLQYALVDALNMTVTKTGTVDLQSLPSGRKAAILGGYQIRNGKLYVEYSFDNGWTVATPSASYLAVIDYTTMTNPAVTTDTRTASPGGSLGYQPFSFTDENNNIYVMHCPGVRIGNYADQASAILRINSSATAYDASYFFDISATIGNHAYGIWYMGNGKAIIKTERKELISTWADYSKFVFDFYVVDLAAKTATKLDVPLHTGAYLQNVVIEDGKAYLGVQSETQGNYVWEYNATTNTLTQGLKVQDGISYLLRMDRIK